MIKKTKLISTICAILLIVFASTIISCYATTTVNQDLSQQNSTQMVNIKLNENNKKVSSSSSRGGRMLDLDHLAGDIGKEEKLAKERSLSGQRQSRILNDDDVVLQSGSITSANNNNEGTLERSRKLTKNKKKMAIKGFIPIISLENNGKEGKHFENAMDSLNGETENDDDDDNNNNNNNGNSYDNNNEENQSQPYAASQTKEQLLSNYGGQTSIGHASFGIQPQDQSQWQQINDHQQDSSRNKKLLGSNGILSSLTNPGKRLVSSLVPSSPVLGYPQLQAPMNLPPQIMNQQQQQYQQADLNGDCVCVPFYQCKGGYLTEVQLSKGPISQLFTNKQHQNNPVYNQQFALGHQVPRSINFDEAQQQLQQQQQQNQQLSSTKDLNFANNNNQQQQLQISNMLSQDQRQQFNQLPNSQQQSNQNLNQQQNVNDLIYEQLRKNIESNNLEQQLLQQQQQPAYVTVDERSKTGNQQQLNNNNNSTESEEVLERSLLNPLGRRQSGAFHLTKSSCGIMRICCKIPPTMSANYPNRFNSYQQQQQVHIPKAVNNRPPQHQILHPLSQHQSQMTALVANNNNINNMDSFINQNQLQDYHQSSTSAQIPITASLQNQQQYPQPPPPSQLQNNYLMQQQSIRPSSVNGGGNFMAGRCGNRPAMGISGRIQNTQPAPGSESTAEFGEFPSHVAILKKLSPGDSMFVCSAVLISNQWIVTAAHCIRKHRVEDLKVRLGEWDVNKDDEFYPFVESNIRDIVIHPEFQPASLINDIALLRLEQSVDGSQMPHISPACLPTIEENFNQQRCWVAGWGKDAFGQQGTFQSVLKKVDLPIIGRQECENALRYRTKLGKYFRLHSSAICAGGERGKDACEGDGGAGLYCVDPESGLTKAIGLVSYGVGGCGNPGIPGIYTNLASLSPWIENIIAASGEENLYMDRNSSGNENSFKNIISERSNGNNNNNNNINNSTNIANQDTKVYTNNSTVISEDIESRTG